MKACRPPLLWLQLETERREEEERKVSVTSTRLRVNNIQESQSGTKRLRNKTRAYSRVLYRLFLPYQCSGKESLAL